MSKWEEETRDVVVGMSKEKRERVSWVLLLSPAPIELGARGLARPPRVVVGSNTPRRVSIPNAPPPARKFKKSAPLFDLLLLCPCVSVLICMYGRACHKGTRHCCISGCYCAYLPGRVCVSFPPPPWSSSSSNHHTFTRSHTRPYLLSTCIWDIRKELRKKQKHYDAASASRRRLSSARTSTNPTTSTTSRGNCR